MNGSNQAIGMQIADGEVCKLRSGRAEMRFMLEPEIDNAAFQMQTFTNVPLGCDHRYRRKPS